jgi:hypothetical protein
MTDDGGRLDRLRERVDSAQTQLRQRIRPVVEARLTDWPTEVGRRVDLTGETAATSGEMPDSELVVYVHGFLGQGRLDIAKMSGAHQAAAFQEALGIECSARNRETPAVVAGMWDSSTTWTTAKARSERAGRLLAEWTRALDQPVHLVGHSLGGRVVLEALDHDAGEAVESVGLLGAAVDPDSVCHTYVTAIESLGGPVYNYHSENDRIVCRLYRVGEISAGLGCRGSDCRGGLLRSSGRVPPNFTDVDVSEAVQGHLDYYKPAEHTTAGNCVGEFVDNHL